MLNEIERFARHEMPVYMMVPFIIMVFYIGWMLGTERRWGFVATLFWQYKLAADRIAELEKELGDWCACECPCCPSPVPGAKGRCVCHDTPEPVEGRTGESL